MAYKIRLPTDFGRKHIGCPAHGNLTIKMTDGLETKANSIILSLNSPVIDDLTTDLLQTTLEMEDFSKAAVDCFIEACYTGEVQLTKDLFRDLNKMAHVFRVYWLITKCYEYFNMLVQQIEGENFKETMFAFEEAAYVSKTLKKQNFSNLIFRKIDILDAGKEWFVTNYLRNLSSRSVDQLKLVVEFAGSNTQLLADAVLATLKTDGVVLDDNYRYLLKSINFAVLREKHRAVYNEIFLLLSDMKDISVDDLRMIVRLQVVETTSKEQVKAALNNNIPNLNCSTKFTEFLNLPFDEFLQRLIDSPDATNLYMFVDAIWMWLFDNHGENTLNMTFTDELLGKIASVMTYRGWKPVTKEYFDKLFRTSKSSALQSFIDTLKESNNIVEEGDVIVDSTEEFSPKELTAPGTTVKFHFPKTSTTKLCTEEGHCGFMLKVTRDDSGSFNIQLSIDPDEYPDDLHFHEHLIFARNMHLVVTRDDGNLLPLSWEEKLECDETGNYWRWGYIQFYKSEDYDKCRWKIQSWRMGDFVDNTDKFKLTVRVVYHGQ